MNVSGFTDSLATLARPPNECPHCHLASRIANGLCLGCLLQTGVAADELDNDNFEAALAAVAIPDTQWRLGNYEILEEIGRGGMGVIYRARQRHSRRIVALKRILSYHADSRDTLARFRREAEAAASLDHPNILPIYEVSESEDGVPFFSMKFAPGGSLQEAGPALRDNPREIVRLMAKVTRAVQYAHRQGILHRDLKPGNILLDGRGEPLVSDFGLAKWLDTSSDLTRTLTIFGTPGYIAPEQAEGPAASLKPTADIYSLGAILFDLLAGRPPFLGEHAIAVIRQAAEKLAPKLRSLVRGADRDLETICARCLEREPAARYRAAGDLAEDLERWLEGRPIIARPILPPVKLWRWSKRNPLLAGTLAITIILGGLAIVRQIETRRLTETVREDELAAHSIAILPFLDLDTAQSDIAVGKSLATALRAQMTNLGPVRLIAISDGAASIPGAGNLADLRTISSQTGCRSALTGTERLVGGKRRVSLHLSNVETGDTLFECVRELPASKPLALDLGAGVARDLFTAVSSSAPTTNISTDPALTNPAANEFLRAGNELLTHRTIADLDRAIACYERAIELQPKSAVARAAFVIAAVQKTGLGSRDSELLRKAERYGREAVAFNGTIESSHRALESLLFLQGNLAEAPEEARQEIEAGGLLHGAADLALIEKMRGRPDLALRWRAISSHRSARPADGEFILGDCWSDLVDDKKAEFYYRRVNDLYPEIPEGWMGFCHLKLLQNDFQTARKIYQENIARYPDYQFAKQMAAQVEFFSRNITDAEKLYTELSAEDPNGGGSFYGCVSFQSALGRCRQIARDKGGDAILEHCLTTEKAALQLAPNHPEALYRIAAIESSLDEIDSSIKHLKAAFAAGWLDYRSPSLDPRFDRLREDIRYREISEAMAIRVASLRRSQSTDHK